MLIIKLKESRNWANEKRVMIFPFDNIIQVPVIGTRESSWIIKRVEAKQREKMKELETVDGHLALSDWETKKAMLETQRFRERGAHSS